MIKLLNFLFSLISIENNLLGFALDFDYFLSALAAEASGCAVGAFAFEASKSCPALGEELSLLWGPDVDCLEEDLASPCAAGFALAGESLLLATLESCLVFEEASFFLSDEVVVTVGEEWVSCCFCFSVEALSAACFWGDYCWAVCGSAAGFVAGAGLCWASLCELDSLCFCSAGVDVDVVALVEDVVEVELLDDVDWVGFVFLAVAGLLVEDPSVVVTEECSLLDGALAEFWSVVWGPLDPLATVLDPSPGFFRCWTFIASFWFIRWARSF